MNQYRWYVLQVKTGTETAVAAELQKRGYWAVVPVENRIIRRRGSWIQEPYIVFTGYVFVYLNYTWAGYYAMSGIKGVVRILGGGKDPSPLSSEESNFILRLTELLIAPSVIRFSDDGKYKIISGFLAEIQDQIIKIDKHAKRASVKIPLAGMEKVIKVSFKAEQIPERTED